MGFKEEPMAAKSAFVWSLIGLMLSGSTFMPGVASAHPEDDDVRWIVDAAVKLQVEPEYPPRALTEGVQGSVRVGFIINWLGGVEDARVLSAEPPGMFELEAMRTIRHWRFEPAREPHTCRIHDQRAEQTFRFVLDEGVARVDIPPTLIEGVVAEDRPVVRAASKQEILAAIQRATGEQRPIPEDGVKALYRKEPQYPREALIHGRSGRVILRFTITEDGKVRNEEIVQSAPGSLFDQVSLNAIRRWKFKPRLVDGKPVASEACQQLNFQMLR